MVTNLLKWLAGPEQNSLRRAFTAWFGRVVFPVRFADGSQPAIEELEEVRTMLAERVKEWSKESLEKGLRKGRMEGLKEGRKEGRHEGAQQVLQRQLEKKFGHLPPALLAKLTQADEEQLLQWSENILFAATLDDVFAK